MHSTAFLVVVHFQGNADVAAPLAPVRASKIMTLMDGV
jgi:hypothetical protein